MKKVKIQISMESDDLDGLIASGITLLLGANYSTEVEEVYEGSEDEQPPQRGKPSLTVVSDNLPETAATPAIPKSPVAGNEATRTKPMELPGGMKPSMEIGTPVPEGFDPEMAAAINRPAAAEQRNAAWSLFKEVIRTWLINFENPTEPQPDRVLLSNSICSGRHTVTLLKIICEIGSLQNAVLLAAGSSIDADKADKVAASMVQISGATSFPDLNHVYDYGTRWRRVTPVGPDLVGG